MKFSKWFFFCEVLLKYAGEKEILVQIGVEILSGYLEKMPDLEIPGRLLVLIVFTFKPVIIREWDYQIGLD